jgi:hypothetical protein
MATYSPPTEDLPIFDNLVFLSDDTPVTIGYANTHYLRFPNAQGTENLQTINVNGVATFNNEIVQADTKRITQATATDNTLPNTLRPTNIYGDLNLLRPTGANGGSLRLWDVTSSSSGKSFQLFDSGNTASIVNLNNTGAINLNVRDGAGNTQDSISCSYSQVSVNANLVMNNASSANRQISTGYLNLNPITGSPGGTGTQLYQSNATSYWDNNVNGGTVTFATNTVGGSQVILMNMTPTYVDTNLPFKINVLGNYLQFPDGTQQFTAATGGKTYTVQYVSTQSVTLPANTIGISVRCIGRGGSAGNPGDGNGGTWGAGGSGGGGAVVSSQGIIPFIEGTVLQINFATYTEILVTSFASVSLCRANGGGTGGNATAANGGAAGIGATTWTLNTSYCDWSAKPGSNGVAGGSNLSFQNYAQIPASAGSSAGVVFSDTNFGCGQRWSGPSLSLNAPPNPAIPLPTGVCYITYYLK